MAKNITPRQIEAAKLVAAGQLTQQEIAQRVGYGSRQAVSQAFDRVMDRQNYDDVILCRSLVDARLEEYRATLIEIARTRDSEGRIKANLKRKPAADGVRIQAIIALVALEKRRCEMFGWDAPRAQYIPAPPPTAFNQLTLEEIADKCREYNLPIPPGLADELAARKAANAGGGDGVARAADAGEGAGGQPVRP